MKILLIQISDIHCEKSDKNYTQKLSKVASALGTLGEFDKVILIFSGDLTNRAGKNEFKTGRALMKSLIKNIRETIKCGYILFYIVPGNHDILLPEGCREIDDILSWNLEEHIDDEIQQMEDFFEYANSIGCFRSNKLYDVQTIDLDTTKIQICLLNSALFSTKKPDDKQVHYLPPYVFEHLSRSEDADFKITIMHHHYEWGTWETKDTLKQSLIEDDIVFFGHDHKAEGVTITNGNGSNINVIMGGEFNLDIAKPSAFNAIVFDSESADIERYEFNWNIDARLFEGTKHHNILKNRYVLSPTDEYLKSLLCDEQQISDMLTDYYVLPKMITEGEMFNTDDYPEHVEVEDIFKALVSEKAIRISGNRHSGKSSLLKYLYYESIRRGYLPLFIEKRDYRDSNIDKMFKDMFELQYGERHEYGYLKYEQSENARKIIFVDDIDLIENSKARDKLVSHIIDSGKLLIYTSSEKNQALEDIVKDKLAKKRVSSLEITPFYKETRDELIENICNIQGRDLKERSFVITALDYMVTNQASFFTLTPGNLIQYIKYYLTEGGRESKGIKTISIVFETNIRNSLLSKIEGSSLNLYLSLLEYIAGRMYFELRSEKISISVFERIVEDYNKKRRTNVNAKRFLDVYLRAQVFRGDDDSFDVQFIDKNTFAYFVAKYLNQVLEKDPTDSEKLLHVMNRICFGINDTIIIFLSYIRNNIRIILKFASKAKELLNSYPEWNFEENNIPFLSVAAGLPTAPPNEHEKKEAKRNAEEVEKSQQEAIKFKSIFDFSEEDVENERFKVLRALKYTQIIGRTLIDQYGTLDADEIETMAEALYSTPQKIIYALFQPYQSNEKEIIDHLLAYFNKEFPEEQITEKIIREALARAGLMLALGIMNDMAYNASNNNTITALREACVDDNPNHKLMLLMMEGNTGNTSDFIGKAIDLREKFDSNSFAQNLIAQITRNFILTSQDITYKEIDKLVSGKVLSPRSKKSMLLGKAQQK